MNDKLLLWKQVTFTCHYSRHIRSPTLLRKKMLFDAENISIYLYIIKQLENNFFVTIKLEKKIFLLVSFYVTL